MTIDKTQTHKVLKHGMGLDHHILSNKVYDTNGDTAEHEVIMFTERRRVRRIELEEGS